MLLYGIYDMCYFGFYLPLSYTGIYTELHGKKMLKAYCKFSKLEILRVFLRELCVLRGLKDLYLIFNNLIGILLTG